MKEANLTTADLENLSRSFISADIVAAAGIYRVDSPEGGRTIGRNGGGDYAGLVYPYRWPGTSEPRSYRLRLDRPNFEQNADGTCKEKAKYLSAPGARNQVYFAPDARENWLNDINLPIIITEGEKKALALSRLAWHQHEGERPRYLALGLAGVWNWRGTVGKTRNEHGARCDVKGVIPDLERIVWKRRTVTILYDANVAINKSVQSARKGLAKILKQRGANVAFVDMPTEVGVNGVDDLLALKGPESVLALLESARPAQVKIPPGFRLSESGVYLTDPTGEKEDIYICSPLVIAAATRTRDSEDWGKLLEFTDADGKQHEWAMPMSMLAGDGSDYRSHLLSSGLTISPNRKAREYLTSYIQTSMPDERVRCVARVGWHDGMFVLPDETFGPGERVLYQSATGERAGLPSILRLYDLRHSCATLLLSAGENAKIVAERLGHSTVVLTLDTYAHVLPHMQEAATAKLERMLFSS